MLKLRHHSRAPTLAIAAKQRGVVLLITLIVLLAMTLGTIALVRSVDTTNVIAGNLSFHQAATHSGDTGVETAIAWLESQNGGGNLYNSNLPMGYSALRVGQDPGANQSWDAFWNTVLTNQNVQLNGGLPDAAGNVVSYSITRMCNAQGDPATTNVDCSVSVVSSVNSGASSQGVNETGLQYSSQVYYRITSRVVGPRNTISYVQAIVAL